MSVSSLPALIPFVNLYINSESLSERERDRSLFLAHSFLFLILQVASYKKHKQSLITAGCSSSPMTPIGDHTGIKQTRDPR